MSTADHAHISCLEVPSKMIPIHCSWRSVLNLNYVIRLQKIFFWSRLVNLWWLQDLDKIGVPGEFASDVFLNHCSLKSFEILFKSVFSWNLSKGLASSKMENFWMTEISNSLLGCTVIMVWSKEITKNYLKKYIEKKIWQTGEKKEGLNRIEIKKIQILLHFLWNIG